MRVIEPIIIIIISAVISTCISKIMAEHYLELTFDQIDKMFEHLKETTRESVHLVMEALNKR